MHTQLRMLLRREGHLPLSHEQRSECRVLAQSSCMRLAFRELLGSDGQMLLLPQQCSELKPPAKIRGNLQTQSEWARAAKGASNSSSVSPPHAHHTSNAPAQDLYGWRHIINRQ